MRSSFREYAPQFELLNPQLNLETRQLTYEATHEMLEEHPDLVGIYCVGGGMEGAIAALAGGSWPRWAREPLVVNEITDETREALQDGTVAIVVGTPLRQLCAELIPLMIHTVENGMAENSRPALPALRDIWTPKSL